MKIKSTGWHIRNLWSSYRQKNRVQNSVYNIDQSRYFSSFTRQRVLPINHTNLPKISSKEYILAQHLHILRDHLFLFICPHGLHIIDASKILLNEWMAPDRMANMSPDGCSKKQTEEMPFLFFNATHRKHTRTKTPLWIIRNRTVTTWEAFSILHWNLFKKDNFRHTCLF